MQADFKSIGKGALIVALSSVGGGYVGYQMSLTAPVPAQYVVVDVAEFARSLQKNIDPSRPSGQIAIKEIGEQIKAKFKRYTDAGIVVLDASQVIAAPSDAFVKLENLEDDVRVRNDQNKVWANGKPTR